MTANVHGRYVSLFSEYRDAPFVIPDTFPTVVILPAHPETRRDAQSGTFAWGLMAVYPPRSDGFVLPLVDLDDQERESVA